MNNSQKDIANNKMLRSMLSGTTFIGWCVLILLIVISVKGKPDSTHAVLLVLCTYCYLSSQAHRLSNKVQNKKIELLEDEITKLKNKS